MTVIPARYVRQLGFDEAKAILDAALDTATRMGVPSSVAIVDTGRELLAFGRQDGALLITGEIARSKAYAARSVSGPSSQLEEATKPTGPFWGLQHGVAAGMVVFGGGFPIVIDGTVVGAIGVGGGTVDDDIAVAQGGLAILDQNDR